MKIISLNCFGIPISFNRKIRFNQIANEINKSDADIVMLQEAIFSKDRTIIHKILENTGYEIYPKVNENFKNGGLMTLTKNIEVASFSFHKYSDQGARSLLTLPDRVLGKGFQHLVIKRGGKVFDLINAHMVCLYKNTTQDQKSYNNQMQELLRYITLQCHNPLILGGDINVRPDSNEITNLKTILKLSDTLPLAIASIDPANLNRGKLMNIFNDNTPFRTDYVLLGDGLKILNSGITFNLPFTEGTKTYNLSDHFGVFAEVNV